MSNLLKGNFSPISINTSFTELCAVNLNLSFKGLDGQVLEYLLNKKGIYVSTSSACDSESIESSHVLKEINVPKEYINGTIRFSIGNYTTFDELIYVIDNLIEIINQEKYYKKARWAFFYIK